MTSGDFPSLDALNIIALCVCVRERESVCVRERERVCVCVCVCGEVTDHENIYNYYTTNSVDDTDTEPNSNQTVQCHHLYDDDGDDTTNTLNVCTIQNDTKYTKNTV